MLILSELVAGYPGGGRVLEGVNLAIAAAERVAVMGRNGMGKTTLLRSIMGHLRPQGGTMTFDGRDIAGLPPYAVNGAGIAYVPQGREIFRDFTVEENLLLGIIGNRRGAAPVPDSIYGHFPILAERRKQKAGTMSGGEQQQLAIARAIVGQPRLLMLDEPSEGIQPSIVQSIARTAAAIARESGMAVLLIEQNLELVLALTTRCLFLENGRIVDQADSAALRGDRTLLDRYLSV